MISKIAYIILICKAFGQNHSIKISEKVLLLYFSTEIGNKFQIRLGYVFNNHFGRLTTATILKQTFELETESRKIAVSPFRVEIIFLNHRFHTNHR